MNLKKSDVLVALQEIIKNDSVLGYELSKICNKGWSTDEKVQVMEAYNKFSTKNNKIINRLNEKN
jgi:hypothetical protein